MGRGLAAKSAFAVAHKSLPAQFRAQVDCGVSDFEKDVD